MPRSQLILASLIAVVSVPACAAENCGAWSADVLQVTGWSAVSDERQEITIDLTIESSAPAPIEMLEAQVRFFDQLGGHIDTVTIDPETAFEAGHPVKVTARTRTQRLVKMRPGNVVAVACTKSVVYDDGVRQEFDQ